MVASLQAIDAQISMSAVGNPYDNAKAESFFRTLNMEEVLKTFPRKYTGY